LKRKREGEEVGVLSAKGTGFSGLSHQFFSQTLLRMNHRLRHCCEHAAAQGIPLDEKRVIVT